jgi:hypothetical protein
MLERERERERKWLGGYVVRVEKIRTNITPRVKRCRFIYI